MKILDAIKKAFSKEPPQPPEKLTPLLCGSIDTNTGECQAGFLNEAGEIVYKPDGKTNVWGNPEYVGTCTMSYQLCVRNLFSYNEYPRKEEKAIYRETHLFNGSRRYFVYDDGQKVYLEPNAYEQHNRIIIA